MIPTNLNSLFRRFLGGSSDKIGNEGEKSVEVTEIPTAPLDYIVISPATITLVSGATYSFTASGYDRYGNLLNLIYNWEVSEGIGQISPSKGTTTIFTAGSIVERGIIQATVAGIKGSATVEVIRQFNISASKGGTIESGDNRFILTIPTASLEQDITISLKKAAPTLSLPGFNLGISYELNPANISFKIPATLTFSYSDRDNDGVVDEPYHIIETALEIYSYQSPGWRSVKATIEAKNNTLSGNISSLPILIAILACSTEARIIRLQPASGLIGEIINIEGVGFDREEEVRIDFGTSQDIVRATVNKFTAFFAAFMVDSQPSGTITITATGMQSGKKDISFFRLRDKDMDEWHSPPQVPIIQPPQPATMTLIGTTPTTIELKAETLPVVKVKEIEVEHKRYQSLTLPKEEQTTELGKPELPVVRRYIELPANVDLKLYAKEEFYLSERYNLYPVQRPLIDNERVGIPEEFISDEGVYTTNRFYPEEIGSITILPGLFRGHRIALLTTYPLQYNPVTGQVKINSNIEVKMEYTQPVSAMTIEERLWSEEVETIAKNFLFPYLPPKIIPNKKMGKEGANYLIITDDSLYEGILPLVEWKQKKGLKVRVVRLSEILDGKTAEGLIHYLKNDVYQTWVPVPSYLLLVGDANLLPVAYKSPHPSKYEQNYKIGTDLYYGAVDGEDYFPDIFVGRLPAKSLDELEIMVNKILNYEKYPHLDDDDWVKRVLLTASRERSIWVETTEKLAAFFKRLSQNNCCNF